mmetsp:Transcript_17844/g.36266  ORF Transcript_17844/g.36266 Transcript_17844/m.36266 type:complete len:213 (-) Transcript_17844:2517-3155(-)
MVTWSCICPFWEGVDLNGAGPRRGIRSRLGLYAPDAANHGADVAGLSDGPADHQDGHEHQEGEEDAPERGEEDEVAHLLEEGEMHREDQRNGGPACGERATDHGDTHAVERPPHLLVTRAAHLVVEVDEVGRVVDRHAHNHHDEDRRDDVELVAFKKDGSERPGDRGADRQDGDERHEEVSREDEEDEIRNDERDDDILDGRREQTVGDALV